ncbi:LysR family transcriptional regulator [Methylobacterium nigriterrae]|uniref:LysR family transcriptional regulator n=1 Tax=Methylobacterium nigriterrae TaxID=3127512 RepID=UPI0030136622
MFLRQFEYLLAVVDEEHFGRAAARCNVTQPSLSIGIKHLESELNVQIFLRGRGHRFHGLTPEGEIIVKWARKAVAHCRAMRDEIATWRAHSGRLRIGVTPSMSLILPALLQRVRAEHPDIIMDVRSIGSDARKVELNQSSLDVVLTHLDTIEFEHCKTLKVCTEELSLLVPDVPELAGRASITWREAAEMPLALLHSAQDERRFVDSVFASLGCHPVARAEADSIIHLMLQVQFGGLCTIVPAHFTRVPGLPRGTKVLQLIDPVVSRQVDLLWAEGEAMTPLINLLVSAVKDLNEHGGLEAVLRDAVLRPTFQGPLDLRCLRSGAPILASPESDLAAVPSKH